MGSRTFRWSPARCQRNRHARKNQRTLGSNDPRVGVSFAADDFGDHCGDRSSQLWPYATYRCARDLGRSDPLCGRCASGSSRFRSMTAQTMRKRQIASRRATCSRHKLSNVMDVQVGRSPECFFPTALDIATVPKGRVDCVEVETGLAIFRRQEYGGPFAQTSFSASGAFGL